VLARVVERLSADSDPADDLHFLIVIARLKAGRCAAQTARIAHALLDLDRKMTERKRNRDTFWPLRLGELYAGLAAKDKALDAALLADGDFGRPDHAFFARASGFDRRRAAEIFVRRAADDAEYPWTPAQVELLGELPAEVSLPLLRQLWERGGLNETILPLLARRADAADRMKFLDSLGSPRLATLELSLAALAKLPPRADGGDLLPLIRALRRLGDTKEEKPLRQRLAALLTRLTGQNIGPDKQAWTDWFGRTYPDLAAKLGNADGIDVAGWQRRLAAIDWSAGVAERGQAVFTRASCAACHSGGLALGPDLRGVAGRFSRQDLFTAILQPNLDVSPRYQTTLLATADGKVYQGLVIYEAVGSLILQTGPTTTERLVDRQITDRRFSPTSLMPAGLLDKLTDGEISDLYAYLRGFQPPP
jgi:putative heme-binding domain-containing protein